MDKVTSAVVWFRDLLDKGQVARSVLLYGTFYMTWRYFAWCIHFAESSQRSGSDVAMILGATGVAISGLQAYVFKAYLDGRP